MPIDSKIQLPLRDYPTIGRASWLIPARVDEPEWLDLGVGSQEDAQANFSDMHRINRYLGGFHSLAHHLYPRLRAHTGVVTMADLGTGSAEIPIAIARWANRENITMQILAVDWAALHLALAQASLQSATHIQLVQADAGNLPFALRSVDYVVSSLFLHHFTPEQVIKLLREAFACVRGGLVMSDVVRGWLPLVAFKLSQPVFARSYLTRHDGAVSVRRAYTPAELRDLAQAAGLTNFRVYEHLPWRMTLVADK